MTRMLPPLARILPFTERNARYLTTVLSQAIQGDLLVALHRLEGLWLRNAPEEDIPKLEEKLKRVVLEIDASWKAPGRMFGTAFTHPEFERVYLAHRPHYEAPCTIEVTAKGLVLEGRRAEWQTEEQMKPWRVELPFADEGEKVSLFDPENPQDPEFIRESLVQLDMVFAQQPQNLYFSDPRSWCKTRFLDNYSVSCTELFPGIWFAVREDSGDDALLVCSAERFAANADVETSSVFLRSPTTLAIRVPGYPSGRRGALWELAWGDTSHQSEAEATRLLLRTLIHDRQANGTSEDVLSKPIVPRPFWCQRYL